MSKKNLGGESKQVKPRVVYDPKMPKYQYQSGAGKSMSVDRRRDAPKASAGVLANLKI